MKCLNLRRSITPREQRETEKLKGVKGVVTILPYSICHTKGLDISTTRKKPLGRVDLISIPASPGEGAVLYATTCITSQGRTAGMEI